MAADRIGLTAMRAANLLGRPAASGETVDRTGAGVVVEVYPAAASLRTWGLPSRGYKGAEGSAKLGVLVDDLMAAAPWLRLRDHEPLCRLRDDALDAVVAALAAALDLTTQPGAALVGQAGREGWIAVPTRPLDYLAGPAPEGR